MLPGDPASLHEAGRISSSFANGRVAAWAAASSAVGVGAVRAVPLSAEDSRAHEVNINYKLREQSVTESELSPGVVLSGVWGLGLAGASVSGGGAWRRTPAAPGAAALSEVGFAPGLLFLPARRVWVASRRRRWAPVVCLTPTGAVVTLGRVAAFCPGAISSIKQQVSNNSL